MARVKLESLSKTYPGADTPVIQNVNFEVNDQEFMVLVGPSGCGKSTTLRIIAGLEEPGSGHIFIGDRDVTRVAPKDRDIAMVFQNYSLYPHLSVFENLAFSLKLRKDSKGEIDRKTQRAAEILDIGHLLKRRPKELSGGQRQRVALGRAIVREPKVFLFDEPLSNLDAKLRVLMRTEILKLHQRIKTTVIYVTHDQMEAMTMGDRIVAMKDGIIQQIDPPMEIYNHPANDFVAGFIGSPSMNFMQLSETGAGLSFSGVAMDGLNLSENVKPKKMGIRPEKLFLSNHQNLDVYFTAVMEVSEEMGHETLYYLRRNGISFIVREMGEGTGINPGNELKVGFNYSDCHFFSENGDIINI
ncbi:MAG: sn-glycerol-3-phosphate ABC transporter ATP-binding protein UgpC [FCB group bacterium]|nr:sn-glycerol-3-phosphate ABC transporter ATP-binding protein UgpC [FCB group bacterium]